MIFLKKRWNENLTINKKCLLLIVLIAFIFIMPQLITHNMVIGSDSIFHFNRFYDASEQIRNKNFEYFISLYGFQQSGRIVNAFYGPIIAYLHGLLVLLSKNWYVYQVLSNFILFVLSGCSMYTFLRAGSFNYRKSCTGAILYMCTFSILYWPTRQGFTSWGAALLPFCLSIIFIVFDKKEVPKFKLGFLTALIFQTHILSSLILVLMYTPIFLYAFVKTKKRKRFIIDLIREVSLFFLLTLNIWVTYFSITRENQFIKPFINHTMSSNTINQGSSYWLINPVSLLLMLVSVLGLGFVKWKTYDSSKKILFLTMVFFLIVSSSIIPWDYLIENNSSIAEIIQFPFRFFVPVTILLIYFFMNSSNLKWLNTSFVILGVIQVVMLMFVITKPWNTSDNYIQSGSKTIINSSNSTNTVKESFFLKDKSKALKIVEKTTPDYLPLYNKTKLNKYKLYEEKIIDKAGMFRKSVQNSQLIITVDHFNKKNTEFPIVIYTDTVLSTGGKKIDRSKYTLSEIGTPIIPNDMIVNNQVAIHFENKFLLYPILLTFGLWILTILFFIKKFVERTYKKLVI